MVKCLMHLRYHQKSGFTLIELSIVLLVIALIVGGVLVGRDLIRIAEIRQTIAQVEKFNTAVNAFRTKFNCLPGDCVAAEEFGFAPDTNGNGDNVIGPCNYLHGKCYPDFNVRLEERLHFWGHLNAAGLVPGPKIFNAATETVAVAGIHTPSPMIRPLITPTWNTITSPGGWAVIADTAYACIGFTSNCNHATVFSSNHHFMLAILALGMTTGGIYSSYDISVIDRKIDDGMPTTGMMVAWHQTMNSVDPDLPTITYLMDPTASTFDFCTVNTSPPQYSPSRPGAACNTLITASF